MRLTILIAGAAALGPILGVAVSGSINTVPKQADAEVLALLDAIPRHADAPFDLEQNEGQDALLDHYPLVTPSGTVQVADLPLHGLFRNRRPARFEYDFAPEPYEFDAPEVDLRPTPALDIRQAAPLSSEGNDTAVGSTSGESALPDTLMPSGVPQTRTTRRSWT